jgi:hypothetical protein
MERDKKTYRKSVERSCSLSDVKAWHLGESEELKKWLDFGFFNHIFVCKNKWMILYYDIKEGEKFHEALSKKLTEELFNELCDYFFELIERSDKLNLTEELFEIIVKSWPAFTIFDEISKYPELTNESMIRRLIRIRQTTHTFSYEISKKLELESEPLEYIFFKGRIIEKSFDEFIKENKIIIEEHDE